VRLIKKEKISQQDIAADLGVSQALVSMVLSGQEKGIHAETYRRIWDHARKVGYVTRKVRPGRVDDPRLTQVGFILRPGHDLYSQSSFFSHVQQGLHDYLEQEGYDTLFLGTETSLQENEFARLSRLKESLLGVVVMGEVSLEFLFMLKKRFPRLVSVAASYPGYCHSVLNNEAQTLDLLVQHLVDLGHSEFAWLGGNAGSALLLRRQEALRQALERRGLSYPVDRMAVADTPRQRQGQEAAAYLIEKFGRERLPTAWIAYNGRMARGAVNYLLTQQVDVPGEVSVVACDGTYICEDEEPTLTGAYADPEKIGACAGELLLRATGKPDEVFAEMVLPATLTARRSSGPCRRAPAESAPMGRNEGRASS
jgi:LacI family transcriptional regulator